MTTTTTTTTMSMTLEKKAEEINLVLSEPEIDLWKLRELALTDGGLVNDTLRKRAWPRLVGIHDLYSAPTTNTSPTATNSAAAAVAVAAVKNSPQRRRGRTKDTKQQQQQQQQQSSLQKPPRPENVAPKKKSGLRRLSSRRKKRKEKRRNSSNSSTSTEQQRTPTPAPWTTTSGLTTPKSSNLTTPPPSPSKRIAASPPPSRPNTPFRDDASITDGEQDDDDDEYFVMVDSFDNDDDDDDETTKKKKQKTLLNSMDSDQIARDTARSTWHLLTGTQRNQRYQMEHKRKSKRVGSLLRKKQARLGTLLNLTLVRTYPKAMTTLDRLRYYQGFHDVASICMAVLSGGTTIRSGTRLASSTDEFVMAYQDEETIAAEAATAASKRMGLDVTVKVLGQVGSFHFRDAMRPDFLLLQTALKLTVFPLLAVLDPQVHDFLWMCGMEPFFLLPWILTWFSHDVRDTALVKRLFDAFLVSHPLLPLYMSIAMVCHPYNRLELLQTECDFAAVHQCLAGLPKNSNRVGWKYRPGDGYVSCEEGEEDDSETISTSGLSTAISDDWVDPHPKVLQQQEDDGSTSETQSLVSSIGSSLRGNDPVPFQEIIDSAIEYMRRIPPRQILALSQRYYDAQALDPMMERVDEISFFSTNLAEWATASVTPADWVLKQRARQSRGMKKQSRRDRRKRSRSRSTSRTRQIVTENDVDDDDDAASVASQSSTSNLLRRSLLVGTASASDERNSTTTTTRTLLSTNEYIELHKDSLAVLACGFGIGEDEVRRQKRKRRKRMVLALSAVVLVACTAVLVVSIQDTTSGYSLFYQRNSEEATLSSELLLQQEQEEREVLAKEEEEESPMNISTGTISPAEIVTVDVDATGAITATQRVEPSNKRRRMMMMRSNSNAKEKTSNNNNATTRSKNNLPKRGGAAAVAKKAAEKAATAMASTLINATAKAMASVTTTTTSKTEASTTKTRRPQRGTTTTTESGSTTKPKDAKKTEEKKPPVVKSYVKQAIGHTNEALWDNLAVF